MGFPRQFVILKSTTAFLVAVRTQTFIPEALDSVPQAISPDLTLDITPDTTLDTTLDSVPQAITSDTTPDTTRDTTLDTTPDTTQDTTQDTTKDTTQDTAPAVAILADRFLLKDVRKGYSFLNVFPSYISLFGTSCSVKLLLLFLIFKKKLPPTLVIVRIQEYFYLFYLFRNTQM